MIYIPIYDKNGIEINCLSLREDVTLTNERICKGNDLWYNTDKTTKNVRNYYKGIGIKYSSHFSPVDFKENSEYRILTDSYILNTGQNVFYMGPEVEKKCFIGKAGIFLEEYQPQFTDFIGTCGSKELSIIENSELFEKTSVEVKNVVNWDQDNHQYYFVLNYKCGRRKYFDEGDPKALYNLLEYMIKEDWNFIWDKQSINDISFNGLVTDVADIFHSKELKNKVGTIYSVLYSLGKLYPKLYTKFLREIGIMHTTDMDYVFNTIKLLRKFGVDTSELLSYGNGVEIYKNVVMNYLINGRNCGDCCYVDLGNKIREGYIDQTLRQWS